MNPAPIILASGSPQRRAILTQLGIPFEVMVSGAEELSAGPPEELALENAYRKAAAVAAGVGGTRHAHTDAASPLILAADTVVALGGRAYGKPEDEPEARETLERLDGRAHRVISGLCVIEGDRIRTAAAVTQVSFRDNGAATLAWYLGTGEWRDRAGGYAIQGRGAALVAGIEGDYLNVVGLPVPTLLDLLPDLLALSHAP